MGQYWCKAKGKTEICTKRGFTNPVFSQKVITYYKYLEI